ncbi:tRNA pseudouridine synthase B, partial [mine drainage metagenome]
MTPVCGFLALDKPSGLSSNQALQRVKRIYGTRRGGYLGTLDPLATGLLPIALGEATKFLPYLLDAPKTYRVEARIGIRTATGDREGEVIETGPIPEWTLAEVARSAEVRVGESLQVPPMYSALKQGGKPLYALARKGIEVERQPRRIVVDRVEVLRWAPPELTLELDCGPGVYIRTWIEDWAKSQGTVAHVSQLRRLRVGAFHAVDMVGIEGLAPFSTASDPRAGSVALMPLSSALGHLAAITLEPLAGRRILQGQTVPWVEEIRTPFVRLHGA